MKYFSIFFCSALGAAEKLNRDSQTENSRNEIKGCKKKGRKLRAEYISKFKKVPERLPISFSRELNSQNNGEGSYLRSQLQILDFSMVRNCILKHF